MTHHKTARAFISLPLLMLPLQAKAQQIRAAERDIEVMVVTSSRQAQALVNLAEAVALIDEDTIKKYQPRPPI